MANSNQDGFLNVYNFIPFPEKKSVRYKDEDHHTGMIRYTITTKTPLFIPNTNNVDTSDCEKHKEYDFFSYLEDGRPVIPGSELRGMVRNLYETLTGSCMGVLNTEERPVKRTAEIFQAALIKRAGDGQYILVEADDCIFRENDDKQKDTYEITGFKEGQKVYFQKIPRTSSHNRKAAVTSLVTKCSINCDIAHPDCGYLIKGMKSPEGKTRKHNAHIFMPNAEKKSVHLTDRDMDGLTLVLENYQEQPQAEKDSYKEYSAAYDEFRKGKSEQYFPVYYSHIRDARGREVLYLAPAKITKEISKTNLGELAGDMKPCDEKDGRCPACDLFGMVGKNNEESMGSRVRFADAMPERGPEGRGYYRNPVSLPELSAPKLGNTEFYLNRPDGADFWTYDYYIKNGEVILTPGILRGRKFYWNQPDMKLMNNVEKTKRNSTVQPVRAGITFSGQVYYDGISEKQLKQLIWILNGGSRTEEECDIVYKLGTGKPLGLGSVELKVEEVKERILEESNGFLNYQDQVQERYLEIGNYDENDFIAESKQEFFNMVSYEKMRGIRITYPITEQQSLELDAGKGVEEGYKWFVQNHRYYELKKAEKGKYEVNLESQPQPGKMAQQRTQHNTKETLPPAKEITLIRYHHDEGENSKKQQGQRSEITSREVNHKLMNPGEYLIGEVTGYSNNDKKLILTLEDNCKRELHVAVIKNKLKRNVNLRQEFPIGSIVEYRYLGKNADGYPDYEYLRKK